MAANWPPTWPPPATELHIFDAEGDVLFILTRSTLKNETAKEDNAELKNTEIEMAGYTDTIVPGPAEHMEVNIDSELPGYTKAADGDRIRAPLTSRLHVVTEVQMRASSKVLSMISPVFHRMLGPDFKEGATLKAAQSVVIHLPDDDSDAMVILLNIIHGRTRQVPRKIDFENDLLTELATLVDYYQLYEVTELFSDTWLRDSTRGKRLWTEYRHSTALRWLWISWVFQDAPLFQDITKLMEGEGEGDSEYVDGASSGESGLRQEYADRLPIPSAVLDTIRRQRDVAISTAIDVVYDLIAKYSGPNFTCEALTDENGGSLRGDHRRTCVTLVLGSLVKGARQANIWPRPEKPPYDFTFDTLVLAIRDIRISTLCSQTDVSSIFDTHGVDDLLEVLMDNIERSLAGLNINDFMPDERRRDLQ